ncbi:MAG: response regulator [Cyclobacteriaceae bacterium]|nr:response regulator [Cyclobacteriaceae bacterium]
MKNETSVSKILNVLIVEDNLGDFVLVEDYLIEKFKKSIHISHCENYKDALQFLLNDKKPVDAILLDINLPDFGGMELINDILSHSIDAPIIVLTGYSDQDFARKSLQYGIDDFLVKDEINPNLLYKSLTFALSRYQYIKEIELRNQKLREISWNQSHLVRAPLSKILGIVNLLEDEMDDAENLAFWIQQLKASANEMDNVIREIVSETQEGAK